MTKAQDEYVRAPDKLFACLSSISKGCVMHRIFLLRQVQISLESPYRMQMCVELEMSFVQGNDNCEKANKYTYDDSISRAASLNLLI